MAGSADTVELLQKSFVIVFYGGLASLWLVLIARRLVQAPPRTRRVLAPLLFAAVVVALRAVFESVFTFVDAPFAREHLFWWQITAVIALPVALFAGLLRARLARTTVGDLVLELEHAPPLALRDALARTLGDPTLEVGFWLPRAAGVRRRGGDRAPAAEECRAAGSHAARRSRRADRRARPRPLAAR